MSHYFDALNRHSHKHDGYNEIKNFPHDKQKLLFRGRNPDRPSDH